MLWLYLDDERFPSHDFFRNVFSDTDTILIFRNPSRLLEWIEINKPDEYSLSFDNDLGIGIDLEGRQVLDKIMEKVFNDELAIPVTVRVHTNNVIARRAMANCISSCRKHLDKYIRLTYPNHCMEITATEKEWMEFSNMYDVTIFDN